MKYLLIKFPDTMNLSHLSPEDQVDVVFKNYHSQGTIMQSDDPFVGQIHPIILRADMEELLSLAQSNDQCDDENFKEMDAIAKRWHLEK